MWEFYIKASACIDPYVYSICHPRFRKEFGRLFLGRDELDRRMKTSMKTSYYVCNQSVNPSIIRKQISNDRNVVNSIRYPKNKVKVQSSILENEVECETNFATQESDLKKKNDENGIVAVEIYPEKVELVGEK